MADPELETILVIKSHKESSVVRVETTTVWEDPMAWGIVFVDAMRILAETYAKEEGATNSQPYLDRIKQGLDTELKNYTSPITCTGPVKKD